jgi:hypothetical protein
MLNFNTKTGVPVTLDGGKTPAFYIDASDINFIEKAQNLYKKIDEYAKKKEPQDENVDVDVFIKDFKEEYDFILAEIDVLLGNGVSEKIFKGRYNKDLLVNFIDFLSSIIEEEKNKQLDKYKKKKGNKGVL